MIVRKKFDIFRISIERLAPILLQEMNKFEVVESGGGGYCAVHSLEYLLSGKKNGGRKFMSRYMEWARERGNPYPKDSDFRNWAGSDWASPVSMFDMLKDIGIDIPFIIYDRGAKGRKVYTSEDIYRLLPKREHDKFRNQNVVRLIVGTGGHWMPVVGGERIAYSNVGSKMGTRKRFRIKKSIKLGKDKLVVANTTRVPTTPRVPTTTKVPNVIMSIEITGNNKSIVCI